MHLRQSQSLRQTMTAHLAPTMSLLALPLMELEAWLVKELETNPALEVIKDRRCPGCGTHLRQQICPKCTRQSADMGDVVCLTPSASRAYHRIDGDDESSLTPEPERLDAYLLKQVSPFLRPEHRIIAADVVARLDEHGFFPESVEELAALHDVSRCDVEHVLSLIQCADPPGVGARSPKEALLLQLDSLTLSNSNSTLDLARAIIQDHFESLARHDYCRIARGLGAPRKSVEAAARYIRRNLNPYPTSGWWQEQVLPYRPEHLTLRFPDVSISFLNGTTEGPLLVEVMVPLGGRLRVSPVIDMQPAEQEVVANEGWTAAAERAAAMARCVQQRNQIMCGLMKLLVSEQIRFIRGGDAELRPLTRTQVAQRLNVNESTISRAVAGKTIALPNGRIIPLSRFFDLSLPVRDRIRTMVATEPEMFSDDNIVELLEKEGIQIARRTVAKYRKMLGILPAHLRASTSSKVPTSARSQTNRAT